MQRIKLASILLAALTVNSALASQSPQTEEQKKIDQLTLRIEALEKALKAQLAKSDTSQQVINQAEKKQVKALEKKVEILADKLESKDDLLKGKNRTSVGGYGELHYRSLDVNGQDTRELDLHRMVLFFGHEFNDWARFVAELEVEHIIASAGSRGAVELEQVYVEFDLEENLKLKTGAMLMPLGIINETHEPTTFYGVERPIIETTIIPTTWWSTGAAITHSFDNGISYDVFVTEGLKTEDPATGSTAEPFNIKKGKQKGSFADAFDLALTSRVKYTGTPGLELAAYLQYQPDLDQSAIDSYAESATLLGGHVIYQTGDITYKGLYARWQLDGQAAAAAGKDIQDGGYVEVDWKLNQNWGVFVRQNAWSLHKDEKSTQTDIGFNFYPFEQVVFKFDYQLQNDDAGNSDGFNLGFGYHF